MIVSEEPRTVPRTTKGHKRTQFETIALLLQGGGALGAYQAGVYQALAEADLYIRIGFLEFQSAQSMRRSLPAILPMIG